MNKIESHIKRIRNKAKKAYAVAYYKAKLNHLSEPERPANLSAMAGQGVINEIEAYFRELPQSHEDRLWEFLKLK